MPRRWIVAVIDWLLLSQRFTFIVTRSSGQAGGLKVEKLLTPRSQTRLVNTVVIIPRYSSTLGRQKQNPNGSFHENVPNCVNTDFSQRLLLTKWGGTKGLFTQPALCWARLLTLIWKVERWFKDIDRPWPCIITCSIRFYGVFSIHSEQYLISPCAPISVLLFYYVLRLKVMPSTACSSARLYSLYSRQVNCISISVAIYEHCHDTWGPP